MIEIRFRDIDPDTGNVSQDKKICTCDNIRMANLVINCLNKELDDPNREIYQVDISGS